MKRLTITLMVLLMAAPAFARNEHIRPYVEGIAAVETGDWQTVEQKMRDAISFQPEEEKSIRTREGLIPYLPHFWLGMALTNQERWDGALAAFESSESQGVIQQTSQFALLRSTVSKIESQKATSKPTAGLDEAKRLADEALKEAYKAQGEATSAGASRLDEFRQGNQKLQDALAARGEGTTEGFRRTAGASTQAIQLFRSAAAKASAQPSGVKIQRRKPTPTPQPPAIAEPESQPVRSSPPATASPRDDAPEPERTEPVVAPRESASRQPAGRVEEELPPTPQAALPEDATRAERHDPKLDLVAAYRLMAGGDLQRSTAMLSSLVIADPEWVDALVLRGYARFLDGTLRRDERLIRAAKGDFRSALALDPDLRLDESSFSPKAIDLLESIRSE